MVDFTSTGIIFTFRRKSPNKGHLARYLAVRAAQKLIEKQIKEDNTRPVFPPTWTAVELRREGHDFIFEFCFKEYFARLTDVTYNEQTKQICGTCEVFREEFEI